MKVLIGIFLAWAAAWFVVVEFAPALWIVAALGFAQNLAFTFVSRGRNSGSLVYHMVASIFSNGIWLGMFVVGVKIAAQAPTFPTEFAIVYVLSTISGSVFAHFLARKVERGKARNVQENQLQALSRRVRELEDKAEHTMGELETYRTTAAGTFKHVQDLHVGLDNHVQAHHTEDFPGVLNGLDEHEQRLNKIEGRLCCPPAAVDAGARQDIESLRNGAYARVEELEKQIAQLRQDVRGGALLEVKRRLGDVEKALSVSLDTAEAINDRLAALESVQTPKIVSEARLADARAIRGALLETPDEYIQRRVGEIIADKERRLYLRIEAIEKLTKKVPGLVKGYSKLREAYLSEDWTPLVDCDVEDEGLEERLNNLEEAVANNVRHEALERRRFDHRLSLLEPDVEKPFVETIMRKIAELDKRLSALSDEVARIAGKLITLPTTRLRRLETWSADVNHKLETLENRLNEYADAEWAAEIEEKVSRYYEAQEAAEAYVSEVAELKDTIISLQNAAGVHKVRLDELDKSLRIHGDWHIKHGEPRLEGELAALGRVLRGLIAGDVHKIKRAVAGLHVRVKGLEGRA